MGMSAPSHQCEPRNGLEDNPQGAGRAMALGLFEPGQLAMAACNSFRRSLRNSVKTRVHACQTDVSGASFRLAGSAREPAQLIFRALEFNPNRQARTS
jgi:hypothetical protein